MQSVKNTCELCHGVYLTETTSEKIEPSGIFVREIIRAMAEGDQVRLAVVIGDDMARYILDIAARLNAEQRNACINVHLPRELNGTVETYAEISGRREFGLVIALAIKGALRQVVRCVPATYLRTN